MNKKTVTIIAMIFAGALIGVAFLSGRDSSPKTAVQKQSGSATSNQSVVLNQNDILSQQSIHWHPELSITIKGEKQTIPSNIGMGMQFAGYPQYDPMMMMTNMHTHDVSGMIHWEVMEGPVKKDDVRLSQFFAVWGKKFTSSCIFDYCNGSQGQLTLKVNGQDNQDFENYLVKDKDNIEIIFQ